MEDSISRREISPAATLDQRRRQRIPCTRPVTLVTSDDRYINALCTDLNSTGIGLDSDRILSVGQRLELLLDSQTRVPLLVIYRMGNHYGMSALSSGEKLMELLPVH
jgi:hypothetical protein